MGSEHLDTCSPWPPMALFQNFRQGFSAVVPSCGSRITSRHYTLSSKNVTSVYTLSSKNVTSVFVTCR